MNTQTTIQTPQLSSAHSASRIARVALLSAVLIVVAVSTLGCSRTDSNPRETLRRASASRGATSVSGGDATDPGALTAPKALSGSGSTTNGLRDGKTPRAKAGSVPAPGSTGGDARPDTPPSEGSVLATVPSSPAKTISGVKLPEGVKGITYVVEFEPYGWAPDDGERKRLLIRVIKSKPDHVEKSLSDLTGRNAVVLIERENAASVSEGGRYKGTITVVSTPERRTELVISATKRL